MNDKPASQILDQIGEYAKNNQGVLTGALATAGAGGLLGGYMSSRGRRRAGETRGQRRMRILRDALLTAGVGGAAAGLGGAAYKQLANALPSNDKDPVTNLFTSPFGRTGMGAAAGGGAWWLSKRYKQEPLAKQILDRASQSKINTPEGGELAKQLRKIRPGQYKATLETMLNNAGFRGLVDQTDWENVNKLGLPMATGKEPMGLSHRFGKPGEKVRGALEGFAAGNMGQKITESGIGKYVLPKLKSLSRSAYRHPGVAAAVAGGALAPELIGAGGLLDPALPNPFVRE